MIILIKIIKRKYLSNLYNTKPRFIKCENCVNCSEFEYTKIKYCKSRYEMLDYDIALDCSMFKLKSPSKDEE